MLDAGIDVLSTVNVQHLESLNDQIAELSGIRVRETIPDSVLGRADEVVLIDLTPGGAARPAARRQDLPARSGSTRRSTTSSASRTSRRCARSRCARSPRRSGTSASPPSSWARARRASPPTRRRRSASGCSRWSSPIQGRSGWCGAPGARPSGSAPSSTCSGSARPARAPDERASARSPRCASSPRCSARGCSIDESDDIAAADRRRRPAATGRPTSCMGRSRPPRGLARLRMPLPAAADGSCCPASTSASSPTAPAVRPARSDDRASDRDRDHGAGHRRSAAGFWLPPHGRRPTHDRAPPRATDPAAVHRPGDLPASVRGRRPSRQSRERHDHARLPRSSPPKLPLDSPLPAQCANAMPLLEAIEQRAARTRRRRRRARRARTLLPRRSAPPPRPTSNSTASSSPPPTARTPV